MNHFEADTITPRLLGTMIESLRVAQGKMIDLRWKCQYGDYHPKDAATLANAILAEIFLPVPVLTTPDKTQSPYGRE
jgi:hypothetical protein